MSDGSDGGGDATGGYDAQAAAAPVPEISSHDSRAASDASAYYRITDDSGRHHSDAGGASFHTPTGLPADTGADIPLRRRQSDGIIEA